MNFEPDGGQMEVYTFSYIYVCVCVLETESEKQKIEMALMKTTKMTKFTSPRN